MLVDEFQDTNMAQYKLLKHLASFHHNLFVVGDADQSIYRWRGADYRNVLRFREDFPDAQVILLEQNYRSTQAILDVAMAVIDHNPQRTPKRLFTERGQGKKRRCSKPTMTGWKPLLWWIKSRAWSPARAPARAILR